MKRNSACASQFFCFSSVHALHCICLLAMATLKLPVFWSSRKLMSLQRTGASALPPLTIFRSLSALQSWKHGTQMGHLVQPKGHRCCCCGCIPAQHRRASMTRSPPPNVKNVFPLCLCCCLANTAVSWMKAGAAGFRFRTPGSPKYRSATVCPGRSVSTTLTSLSAKSKSFLCRSTKHSFRSAQMRAGISVGRIQRPLVMDRRCSLLARDIFKTRI
jgi:hypothetical protein